jgi:RNA polymerase sigma factor (sigma-70 family)
VARRSFRSGKFLADEIHTPLAPSIEDEVVMALTVPRLASVEAECERTTRRLAQSYDWSLSGVERFAHVVAGQLTERPETRQSASIDAGLIERACIREYFAQLHDDLGSDSDDRRERAVRQLFDMRPLEEGGASTVLRGYLVKAALRFVNDWRRKFAAKLSEERVTELAGDAASSALASITTNLAQCRDRTLFWGWATRIVENAAIDQLRRLRGGVTSLTEPPPDDEPDPASKIVDTLAVRHDFIRKCRIGKLSPEQRVTLFKFFWEETPVPEIANHLTVRLGKQVTAGNVSVWKTRGLRVLAKNLRHLGFR